MAAPKTFPKNRQNMYNREPMITMIRAYSGMYRPDNPVLVPSLFPFPPPLLPHLATSLSMP